MELFHKDYMLKILGFKILNLISYPYGEHLGLGTITKRTLGGWAYTVCVLLIAHMRGGTRALEDKLRILLKRV